MAFSKLFLSILLFNLLLIDSGSSSVVLANECKVSVIITKVKSSVRGEVLFLKITKKTKLGSAGTKCDFIKVSKEYFATISNSYSGKTLTIPPLAPGVFKVRDIFQAKLNLIQGTGFIAWNITKNSRSLPEGTSFQTSVD